MGMSHSDLVRKFEEGATRGKSSSMLIDGDTLYSWGHHWPLAVRGDFGCGIQYILNHDKYSVSTSRHYSEAKSLYPHVTLSRYALRSQGLYMEDISILHITPENRFEVCKTCGKGAKRNYYYYASQHEDGTDICTPRRGRWPTKEIIEPQILIFASKDGREFQMVGDEITLLQDVRVA